MRQLTTKKGSDSVLAPSHSQ